MTEMNQELIDGLQEVGFTDYESRSIIALMQQSPATVYEERSGLLDANLGRDLKKSSDRCR